MTESPTESSIVADPVAGDFVAVRGKSWIVEGAEKTGPLQTFHLVSCEDDLQGETIQLAFATELQTQVLDPNDWSPLLTKTFEEPPRLGAYLRSTEWRTATAADRKLFQAPFRAGIRLDSYQLLPLSKALDLPRVNLLIADDVGLGKTVEAGLIVRELLLRRRIEMIVVAAPASMLLQWQDELAQKVRPRLHDRRSRAPVGDQTDAGIFGQSMERGLALHRLAQRLVRRDLYGRPPGLTLAVPPGLDAHSGRGASRGTIFGNSLGCGKPADAVGARNRGAL